MEYKTEETSHNINPTFGQGTVKKLTAQHWFQKFHDGDESLEDEEHANILLQLLIVISETLLKLTHKK